MADVPHALTIAGSDPSGGAGIQADLKTFHAHGVYGMAVLTSLTAQNTRGVTGIHDVPASFVREQLTAVFDDVEVHAAKTGMLKSAEIIRTVAEVAGPRVSGRLVVDPVMVATSGDRLVEDEAIAAFRDLLFPHAAVVTPNREEAAVLAGREVVGIGDARQAAGAILDSGAAAVLVKGIPDGDDLVDLLLTADSEREYRLPSLPAGPTHGSGCTLSAALAAELASGRDLHTAVRRAKSFVWRAIRDAFAVGGGSVPLNHFTGVE